MINPRADAADNYIRWTLVVERGSPDSSLPSGRELTEHESEVKTAALDCLRRYFNNHSMPPDEHDGSLEINV